MSSKDASMPVDLLHARTMAGEKPVSAPVIGPLVSVAITSYNSARWLPRALESVLDQRTDFPIEIVIGDDCSQDETVQVARSYQEKRPGLVRVLERGVNVGTQRNYYGTFEECRGKYIAWLDADDYWTDPDKLAKQIKELEADPTISACCHFVRWVTPEGQIKNEKWPYLPSGRYGIEEILRADFIGTASVIFRNGIQRNLPAWYFDIAPITDWPIWVLSALAGDILLLDEVMANYVHTPGSAFNSRGTMFLWNMEIRFYDYVETILPSRWRRFVRKEKGKRYECIAYWVRKEGNFAESRQAAVKAFRAPFLIDRLGSKSKSLIAAVVREAQWKLSGRQAKS
jgi:glycosyltransferase involved in cell wall biosynthesis